MNDLENIKNVNGYEVTVFIEGNNYEKLKEKAKNKNTTIDLLIETLINNDCSLIDSNNSKKLHQTVIETIKGYRKSVSFTEQGIKNILDETHMDINHLVYALFSIVEDDLRDNKYIVQYNYLFLSAMFDTMRSDFVDEKKQKYFEMFYQSILDRGLKNARK